MNILLTLEERLKEGSHRNLYFPKDAFDKIKRLGGLSINDLSRPFTENELAERLENVEICITHWGCPRFTDRVLNAAGRLKLIAHAAGSVADIVTDEVYKKGIKVCSVNDIMARYVAEGILAYILASLRKIPKHDGEIKSGVFWERDIMSSKTLYNAKIGFIGLGAVGKNLITLLEPFNVEIKLYDPYINNNIMARKYNVRLVGIDEVISWANIISIHTSLSKETYHMIDEKKLKMLRNGVLLVNAARGAVIDEAALEKELMKNRFYAVLDVFEREPLPAESRLRGIDNVILMPHMAASTAKSSMTYAIIDEIERYINGFPLEHEISFERYKLMTRNIERI